jgi:hypothetical protein
LARKVFPGGCFFAAAVAEFDTHPGPVKDKITEVHRGWLQLVESLLTRARESGDIDEREEPAQLAFEIEGFLLMANMAFVLYDDPKALARARQAVHARIGRARPLGPTGASPAFRSFDNRNRLNQ